MVAILIHTAVYKHNQLSQKSDGIVSDKKLNMLFFRFLELSEI